MREIYSTVMEVKKQGGTKNEGKRGKNVWGCEGDERLQRKGRTQNEREEQMVLYLSSQNGITLPPNLI